MYVCMYVCMYARKKKKHVNYPPKEGEEARRHHFNNCNCNGTNIRYEEAWWESRVWDEYPSHHPSIQQRALKKKNRASRRENAEVGRVVGKARI